jgi:hypothetical protein
MSEPMNKKNASVIAPQSFRATAILAAHTRRLRARVGKWSDLDSGRLATVQLIRRAKPDLTPLSTESTIAFCVILAGLYEGNGTVSPNLRRGPSSSKRAGHFNGAASAQLRCDHCRAKLQFVEHRYWNMRFCCGACMSAYQQRLSPKTQEKILALDFCRPSVCVLETKAHSSEPPSEGRSEVRSPVLLAML